MPTEELNDSGGLESIQQFMQPMPQENANKEQFYRLTDDDTLFHCNRIELDALNKAQGGEILEPQLGIPIFTKLWKIIQSTPELAEAIHLAFEGYYQKKNRTQINHELDDMVEVDMPSVPQIDFDRVQLSPELEQLKNLGKGKDKELAIMPKEMLYFIWEGIPDSVPMSKRINDQTNLPQFFLGGLLSILGGIAGAVLGGPMGMAIGSGLGNLGGEFIENQSRPEEEKKSFMEMLGGSALTGGLSYLGGTFLGGGAADIKAAGLTPWLIAGGGGLLKEQGENKRNQQKYINQENKRIQDYRDRQEKDRLENLEREKQFNIDKRNAYLQYLARFRPNTSYLSQNRQMSMLPMQNDLGNSVGHTFGYTE